MKNVTIALDDDSYRRARILAAEQGTSLSALVKQYLNDLAAGDAGRSAGVRDMKQGFHAAPPLPPAPIAPRTLGQMAGEIWLADDWDVWPDDVQAAFDALYEGVEIAKP